jgi:hypothetical protein
VTEVWKTYRQPSAAGDWPSAKLSLQTRTDFADFASPVGQAARLASEAKTLAAPTVDIIAQRFFSVWFKMSFKQKLVVRGKTYDCPMVWAFGNQREPYRASVSQCDCELMGDQFEKRWVVSLVRNKDFVPARPTGLEGICQL